MIQTRTVTGRAMSIPGGLAVGVGAGIAMTLAGSVILTKLVLSETMQMENLGYGIVGLLLMSSFIGAVTACGRVKRRPLLICMLSGGLYFLILLSITALFFGGQYNGVGVTGLLVLGGSGAAALVLAGKGSGKLKRPKWKRK